MEKPIQEMIDLIAVIQQSTDVQKDDVVRFIDLSCQVMTRLQKQASDTQQQTIDYCTQYREQVAILTKANADLASILFRQMAVLCHIEGHA
jgi:hypothetical protein